MNFFFRETRFLASFSRNFLIQFFWWIIFYPGFFSADSFSAVDMARTGKLTNSFTAIWALYVRGFSFNGHAIGLLTLVDALILVYSITVFAYSIFNPKTASMASFLITLTPLVWAMGITLWHDILMSAGLLLIVAFFSSYLKTNSYSKSQIFWHLGFGSLLITFRPNGLPTVILFVFLLLLFTRRLKLFRLGIASICISTVITLLTSLAALGLSPINSLYAQEWMRNDISCFASTSEGIGFVEKQIPNIGSTYTWKSSEACKFLSASNLTEEQKRASKNYVPSAWANLAISHPWFILKTHSERNAYLLPIPFFGLPKVPFLHSSIEFTNKGIAWNTPTIANYLRQIIRLWNAMGGLLAWAGLWINITLLLILKMKKLDYIISMLMWTSLIITLTIFAPIPDARYAAASLISGQLIAIGYLVEVLQKPNISIQAQE